MTRDNDGDTPLHVACQYGNTHIVQCLLSTGKVDPMAKNKNGTLQCTNKMMRVFYLC